MMRMNLIKDEPVYVDDDFDAVTVLEELLSIISNTKKEVLEQKQTAAFQYTQSKEEIFRDEYLVYDGSISALEYSEAKARDAITKVKEGAGRFTVYIDN